MMDKNRGTNPQLSLPHPDRRVLGHKSPDCRDQHQRKEAAKVLLGHASTSTTEIYLLEEVQEAMKVAKALSAYNPL